MKSKLFLYFVIFYIISAFHAVRAEELSLREAQDFAFNQGNMLLEAFSESDKSLRFAKLDKMFSECVDIEYIAKFVVGKYWREMSDNQKTRYLDIFKRYAKNAYKGLPLQFDNRISFKILSSRREADNVFVSAEIIYRRNTGNQETFAVEFRMHKPKSQIMLTDVKIGESSLIVSYRTKFYQMIKAADEDMEWFLEDFEISAASAEKQYALPDD